MRISRLLRGYSFSNSVNSSRDAVRQSAWFRPRTIAQHDTHAGNQTRSLSTTPSLYDGTEVEETREPSTTRAFRVQSYHTPRKVSTFAPTRLTSADYFDLSLHAACTSSSNLHEVVSFFILPGRGFKAGRFPPDTRGFLYYYHDPATPPLAGELRFRVTSGSDPSLFASGHDLLVDSGLPWSVSVIKIASRETLKNIKHTLVQDGLVSEEVMAQASIQPVVSTRILHSFGQPFTLGFGRSHLRFLTVGWDAVHYFKFRRVTVTRLPPDVSWATETVGVKSPSAYNYPYITGSAICCFEKSTLPQHAGKRVVVCRVLRVVDPIKPSDILHVPDVLIPREGDLLRISIREAKQSCWFVDVDTKMTSRKIEDASLADGLAVLFDNEARAQAIMAS
ncbi:hypothetical protein C8Q73DRAFT_267165 [Cubamyces lactineus]|nr:hypothetical protein C8Q73DRAFT_267165 [Cubamyces lactineus]